MQEEIRLSRKADETELKALWKLVFDDEEGDINRFFECFFEPGSAMVADFGNGPVCATHMITLGDFVLQSGEKLPCSYIYALATHPDCRGQGLGAAVTKAAIQHSVQAGFSANVIKPAETSLFSYYKDRVGYQYYFSLAELTKSADEIPVISQKWGIDAVAPMEYLWLRERFLEKRPHIAFNERCLAYQKRLSCGGGGDLYALHFGDEYEACAAAERLGDGTVLLKELLMEPARWQDCMEKSLALIQSILPSDRYIVRIPADQAAAFGGKVARYAMMMPVSGREGLPGEETNDAWFGFAFD